jgi:AbrB family looped-hinge helix DNA binding protein
MTDKSKCKKFADSFYGTVTVGERGQIVIPAEARRDYGLETGEKLIVIGGPDKNHLIICKVDSMMTFLESMLEGLKNIDQKAAASPESTVEES